MQAPIRSQPVPRSSTIREARIVLRNAKASLNDRSDERSFQWDRATVSVDGRLKQFFVISLVPLTL